MYPALRQGDLARVEPPILCGEIARGVISGTNMQSS